MRDGRAMKRYVMKDPFETAAGISKKLKANNNKEVSRFTVFRRLNEFGLKAALQPLKQSSVRRTRRFEYAESHVGWRDGDWERVHFSDESKFNLVGSDSRRYARRATGDRLNPKCVNKSAKHGGGSVMVWGMLSAKHGGGSVMVWGMLSAKHGGGSVMLWGMLSAKHGGGSVMVWGMFSSEGVGPLVSVTGTVNAISKCCTATRYPVATSIS